MATEKTAATEQPMFGGEGWGTKSLAGDFILPPFDVMSAQRGEWQARKRLWIDVLNLNAAALGRDEWLMNQGRANPVRQPDFYRQKNAWSQANGRDISTAEFGPLYVLPSDTSRIKDTTSKFDPVLAEISLAWYSSPGWRVFDPFGGGVERGLVSAYLGRPYVGVELRPEQVEINQGVAAGLELGASLEWVIGDAREARQLMEGRPPADMVLTCPPYWNLEVYSDLPADLSNMDLDDFRIAMDVVIEASLAVLRPDRFAVMVMGDRRYGKERRWAHLPHMMVESFEDHGALLHNDIVLLTSLGSKPQIARYAFERRRTLMPLYEHVLVFCKGDPKKATAALGDVELVDANHFIGSGGQFALV